MRVNVAALFAILLVVSSVPAHGQQTSTRTLSGEAAKLQVDALSGQIGERPAGSTNYDQAATYASGQLLEWGYQPTLQPFPIVNYDDRGATLDVVSGGVATLAPDTLMFSAGSQVEAPLVAVGGVGAPEDLAGVDVQGKIALVQRGTLRFADKVANAAAAGATGVIVYNNEGSARVRGSLARMSSVPAVTVSGDDGQRLLQLLSSGPVVVRLGVDASTSEQRAANVIAELQGGTAGPGVVVFGGHLDSVPGSPGANDNASGSAVVLELARQLASVDPSQRPHTVRFVLFGAEEIGLFGSRHYVDTLSESERRSILAMINLDMVGVGDQWRFGGTESLVQAALGATNELGEQALPMRGPQSGASDHANFLSAGIPALFIHRVDDPNYHSGGDRPGLIDPNALSSAGTIALRVLESLEN